MQRQHEVHGVLRGCRAPRGDLTCGSSALLSLASLPLSPPVPSVPGGLLGSERRFFVFVFSFFFFFPCVHTPTWSSSRFRLGWQLPSGARCPVSILPQLWLTEMARSPFRKAAGAGSQMLRFGSFERQRSLLVTENSQAGFGGVLTPLGRESSTLQSRGPLPAPVPRAAGTRRCRLRSHSRGAAGTKRGVRAAGASSRWLTTSPAPSSSSSSSSRSPRGAGGRGKPPPESSGGREGRVGGCCETPGGGGERLPLCPSPAPRSVASSEGAEEHPSLACFALCSERVAKPAAPSRRAQGSGGRCGGAGGLQSPEGPRARWGGGW